MIFVFSQPFCDLAKRKEEAKTEEKQWGVGGQEGSPDVYQLYIHGGTIVRDYFQKSIKPFLSKSGLFSS